MNGWKTSKFKIQNSSKIQNPSFNRRRFSSLNVWSLEFNRGIVSREERYLEKKFGGTYVAYKARVRRWI